METGRRVLAGMVAWLAGTISASACSCDDIFFEELFYSSAIVFEGVAVSTRPDEPGKAMQYFGGSGSAVTTFQVKRNLKGTGFSTRKIRYHTGRPCPVGFIIGSAYQIFAIRDKGHFRTYLCSYQWIREAESGDSRGRSSLRESVRKIRKSRLDEFDAEELLRTFHRKQVQERRSRFVKDHTNRARWAAELAAEGDISGESGALNAAEFYENRGDFERAAEMFALIEKHRPGDAMGPAGRGRALYLAGHGAAAIPHLERALRLDPDHPEAGLFLARARLAAQGRLTPGVGDYRGFQAPAVTLDGTGHANLNFSEAWIGSLSARNAQLPGARLRKTGIDQANFSGADLTRSRWTVVRVSKADFSGARMNGAYMTDSSFYNARFSRADLRKLRAHHSSFSGADLRQARLDNADFTASSFDGTRLEGMVLRSVNFTRAELTGTRLQAADLRGAVLEATTFLGARIDCRTKLPSSINVRRDGLIPVSASCSGKPQNRDFSGRDWAGTHFSGLDLRNASFAGAEFSAFVIPYSWNFTNSSLQNADFSRTSGMGGFGGSDLTGADFSGSTMTMNAWFHGRDALPPAILSGTNFTGARLRTSALVGPLYVRPGAEVPDYRTARFERAQVDCSYGSRAKEVERQAAEKPKPAGKGEPQPFRFGPRHAAVIAEERKLVRFLRTNWPSVIFDESCEAYAAPPRKRRKRGRR